MSPVLVLVPGLPLVAAALLAGGGRRLARAAPWIAVGAVLGAGLVLVAFTGARGVMTARWLDAGGTRFTVGLELVPLTFTLATLVVAIGAPVTLYAAGYIRERRARFFAWLCAFLGGMLALVLASSMLLLFAAWELVGVASWALIAQERDDPQASRAATRAFLATRAADVLLLVGWLAASRAAGTTEIAAILDLSLPAAQLVPIAALIVAGVLGKSAQLPLSAWLPAAMIGPTPVSALLHSATMVAAGVFLLARLFPLLAPAPGVLDVLAWIAAATALAGAVLAAVASELKRVLAWSTVAHLGVMMLAIALGGPAAAIILLVVHAVYKAALFLAAGIAERAAGRRLAELGGLARALPWTFAAFVAAGLALAAVPPLAGFYADEHVLGVAVARGGGWPAVVVAVTAVSAFAIARASLAWRGPRADAMPPPSPWLLRGPLLVLAAAGVVAGPPVVAIAAAWRLPALPPTPTSWKVLAIAGSATGILGAVWVVLRRGLAPAAARALARLDAGVDGLVRAPVAAAGRAAGGVAAAERGLAIAAVRGAAAAGIAASALSAAERGLAAAAARGVVGVVDATAGLRAGERVLDHAGQTVVTGTLGLARAVELGERAGFERGGDGIAAAIDASGGTAARLQSGRLYLYTLALFALIAAVAVAGIVGAT